MELQLAQCDELLSALEAAQDATRAAIVSADVAQASNGVGTIGSGVGVGGVGGGGGGGGGGVHSDASILTAAERETV